MSLPHLRTLRVAREEGEEGVYERDVGGFFREWDVNIWNLGEEWLRLVFLGNIP